MSGNGSEAIRWRPETCNAFEARRVQGPTCRHITRLHFQTPPQNIPSSTFITTRTPRSALSFLQFQTETERYVQLTHLIINMTL